MRILLSLSASVLTATLFSTALASQGPSEPCPSAYERLPNGQPFSLAYDSLVRVASTLDPSQYGSLSLYPHTREPELKDPRQFQRLYSEAAAELLQKGGASGQARVAFWITPQGRVQDLRELQSSGNPTLDSLTFRLVGQLRFRPAQAQNCAVPFFRAIPVNWNFRTPHP